MGGGLLQLVAYGAQDAYITGNPQITFWKGLFKRHTNFAMEPFRVNFTGQAAWGTKHTALLGRHADLLYTTYLEVTLPTGVFNNDQGRLGYNLIKWVELSIGGQSIDRLYGEWMFLWDTLSSDVMTSKKLWNMVGGGPNTSYLSTTNSVSTFTDPASCNSGSGKPSLPNTLYIPLAFFYTRNPGAALPLIALQYHEVKIDLLWNDAQFIAGDFTAASSLKQPVNASIYVDYIYLDVEERRRMAQESHEYLIEQVQFNEDKGISSYNNRIDLTFNHPVKELVWVVQPSEYRTCKGFTATTVSITLFGTPSGGKQDLTFSSVPSSVSIGSYLTVSTSSVAGNNGTYVITNIAGLVITWANTNSGAATVTETRPGFVGTGGRQSLNRLQPFTYDLDAVHSQWLQINGQDRMDKRYGDYFNQPQMYQHHTGLGGTIQSTSSLPIHQRGIYMYSFALKPEEHQPSGTCNFSRIDTATIVMNISGEIVVDESVDRTFGVRVYAVNYNILRIMSGMAGLAYSN